MTREPARCANAPGFLVNQEAPAPRARPDAVWVSPSEPAGHAALVELLKKLSAPVEADAKPSTKALCLVTPLGDDATTCAVQQGLDPRRTVAIDTLFPLDRRRVMMDTPVTDIVYRDAAHGLLSSDGVPVTVIRDSPGFVAQRIVAMIVNIGCAIAQNLIATPADIDKAVTLGLNYPSGPFKFADTLGAARIHKVLAAMYRIYGDPRYRPSIWLARRAQLGVSVLTEER